jgi:sensor histidine kinase regulating citrate/malate metabolism
MDFEEANGVCFSIKDNGIGVKSEDIGHIFNHGKSSKQGGSGNGLHASANFAKGFGGQISLQSEGVDEGALVEVWLPHQTAV